MSGGKASVVYYRYDSPKGKPRVRKRRYHTATGERRFTMQSWGKNQDGKPVWLPTVDHRRAFAEGALYRLPETLEGIAAGRDIVITEGEKDADALTVSWGCVATSGWQGASEFNPAQAQRLLEAKHIWVMVDNDLAGAFSGALRRERLTESGYPAKRITVVAPPRRLNDAYDAVEAGLSWRAVRTPDLSRLYRAADAYADVRQTPSAPQERDGMSRREYDRLTSDFLKRTGKTWEQSGISRFDLAEDVETELKESDDLKNWKPEKVETRTSTPTG